MAAFKITPWRLISGILGVMCLVLMTTLGMLLTLFINQRIPSTPSPGPTAEPQGSSDCCSCPEKWIGYRCNCYFISNEVRTWAESRDVCTSQNSGLLQLQSGDKLNFMNSSENFYWIGLFYSQNHSAWLWENGSAFSQDQFSLPEHVNSSNCLMYKPPETFSDVSCRDENYYICEQQLS